MRISKFIALLLVLGLTAGLAACGKKGAPSYQGAPSEQVKKKNSS